LIYFMQFQPMFEEKRKRKKLELIINTKITCVLRI
jgi:hypothetical protein